MRGVGARVGADVPFCISGGTALGEGVGEVLTPLPAPPAHRLVVAKPLRSADTGGIYRAYDATERRAHAPSGPSSRRCMRGSPGPRLCLGNDLAPVTRNFVPEVAELEQELLASGALGASMSGSGTAVFGIFDDEETAGIARVQSCPFVGVYEPVSRGVENV